MRDERSDAVNGKLQLVRIDGETGLPEAGFGAGGVVLIDPNTAWASATYAYPATINELENGELLVTAGAFNDRRTVGTLHRVARNGAVPARSALDAGALTQTILAGGGVGPDDTLWVAGSTVTNGTGAAFRARAGELF